MKTTNTLAALVLAMGTLSTALPTNPSANDLAVHNDNLESQKLDGAHTTYTTGKDQHEVGGSQQTHRGDKQTQQAHGGDKQTQQTNGGDKQTQQSHGGDKQTQQSHGGDKQTQQSHGGDKQTHGGDKQTHGGDKHGNCDNDKHKSPSQHGKPVHHEKPAHHEKPNHGSCQHGHGGKHHHPADVSCEDCESYAHNSYESSNSNIKSVNTQCLNGCKDEEHSGKGGKGGKRGKHPYSN